MASERPSKSAKKREAHAIRALADELVALKPQNLAKVIDDPDILAAVKDAQEMGSHGAMRRQKQYIARRMREHDLDAIKAAMAQLAGDPMREKKQFKTAESLRDALLKAEPDDIGTLLAAQSLAPDAAVIDPIKAFHSANSDKDRKSASRKIFRAVHAALGDLPVD
ncbi:MAG: ribosome biogenesis factor YjgA [Woeseiaceae bacterium]